MLNKTDMINRVRQVIHRDWAARPAVSRGARSVQAAALRRDLDRADGAAARAAARAALRGNL